MTSTKRWNLFKKKGFPFHAPRLKDRHDAGGAFFLTESQAKVTAS